MFYLKKFLSKKFPAQPPHKALALRRTSKTNKLITSGRGLDIQFLCKLQHLKALCDPGTILTIASEMRYIDLAL